jgi:Terminase small subunit
MIDRMNQATKPQIKRAKPKKKEPLKIGRTKGGLTPQQETFATEIAKGKSQAEAYRIAYPKSLRWMPDTVFKRSSELARHGGVLGRVEELYAIAAKANEVTVTDVLRGYMEVLRADPRKLIAYHRGACRHCYGIGHRFHYTPAEFELAQEAHEVKRLDDPLLGEFDPKGGVGFDPRKAPHQDCPECHGDGDGRAIVGDTRGFERNELALYEGVKVKKDGIEVCMASRMDALDKVARHVGFYEKDNEVKVGVFDAGTLEAKFRAGIEKSMERQAAIVAERRKDRAGR